MSTTFEWIPESSTLKVQQVVPVLDSCTFDKNLEMGSKLVASMRPSAGLRDKPRL